VEGEEREGKGREWKGRAREGEEGKGRAPNNFSHPQFQFSRNMPDISNLINYLALSFELVYKILSHLLSRDFKLLCFTR